MPILKQNKINIQLNLEYMSVTPKEKEVLQLLAVGMSSKQIAEELTISFHTVESHRKSLRQKFGARNVAEVITKAYQAMTIQLI